MAEANFDSLVEAGEQKASELLHRSFYDPVKAREYYLRTRKLKGRRPATQAQPSGRPRATGKSNAEMRRSRRKQLEAEKARLERRIEELKNALELLVEAAKKRAGVKPEKDDKSSDPKETADRNSKEKKDKPLTAKQKREKREASREQYEKEKGMTLSKEVQQLREQAQDIRAKLEAAIEDAQKRQSKKPRAQLQSTTQTASNGR